MREAGAGEIGAVVGERYTRIESNTKTANKGIRGVDSVRRTNGVEYQLEKSGSAGRSLEGYHRRVGDVEMSGCRL